MPSLLCAGLNALGYLPQAQGFGNIAVAGGVLVLLGIWVHLYGIHRRVEVSEDRLTIFDPFNRRRFDSAWSEVTEYVRVPTPIWKRFGNPRPRWRVTSRTRSAWVPFLEEYIEFQRIAFSRLLPSAIPDRYVRHVSETSVPLETQIHEYSLCVDNDGLSVSSPVSRASIRWSEMIFVEEVAYPDYVDSGDLRVPRVHILARTDSFELTRAWDRYAEIRDAIFAHAPEGAIVVR